MSKRFNFTTQIIRFSNVGWRPYVWLVKDSQGMERMKGITGSMLDYIIGHSLGIKYEVTMPNDRQWGSMLENGTWTGMIGALTKDEADIAVGPFVMTEDEAKVAIPSPTYTDEDMVILSGVRKEHESNVYGYITTMDYQVWLLLLFSCVFMMCVIGVFDKILVPEWTKRQRKEKFFKMFWLFLSTLFLEGTPLTFNLNPHRVLLAFWTLSIFVIMHTFIAYMESTMMVKSETFRIDKMEQLIKLPKVHPMVFEHGGYMDIFENADGHAFKQVMDQIMSHGGEAHGEEMFQPEYLRRVLNQESVILMEPISLITRVGPQCGHFIGEGLFHIGRQRLVQIKMVFYMRKEMEPALRTEIIKRIRWIMDSGLNRHWHEEVVRVRGSCWTAEHADHIHDYSDLNYEDLASIFYLYFVALGVAGFVLMIEEFTHRGRCCQCVLTKEDDGTFYRSEMDRFNRNKKTDFPEWTEHVYVQPPPLQ